MIILPILTTLLTHFPFRDWENVLLSLGAERVDMAGRVKFLRRARSQVSFELGPSLTNVFFQKKLFGYSV